MSDNDNDSEWDEKSDLTRIEDLSEFLHEEDPDVDEKLKNLDIDEDQNENQSNDSSTDIEDLPPTPIDEFREDENNDEDQEDDDDDNHYASDDTFSANDDDQNIYQEQESIFDEDTLPEIPIDALNDNNLNDEEQFALSDEELQSEDDFNSSAEGPSFFDTQGEGSEEQFENEDQNIDDEDFSQFTDSLDETSENEQFDSSDNLESDQFQEDERQPLNSEQLSQTPQYDQPHESSLSDNANDVLDTRPQHSWSDSDITTSSSSENEPIHQPREDFKELQDFGNSITYGHVSTGANPPYSVILRAIEYSEDAEDIKIILSEHGLYDEQNSVDIDRSLEQGGLLISQISEYSAIYLAHRLRRFRVNIRIGLSDQLHHSKSYSHESRGLVSKYNLKQNKFEDIALTHRTVELEDIIIATSSSLENKSIEKYLDIITSHSLIDEIELIKLQRKNDSDKNQEYYLLEEEENELDEKENQILQNYSLGLNEVYHELACELKNQAYKIDANAVLSLNYTITPITLEHDDKSKIHYKITCTGNAVWLVDNKI